MTEREHGVLLDRVKRLRRSLSWYSTAGVIRVLSPLFIGDFMQNGLERGLLAPYKQMTYLLGLLLTTPEPKRLVAQTPEGYPSEETFQSWIKHLTEIFDSYSFMFFPTAEERDNGTHQTDEWRFPRAIAMPAFLHYFTSSRVMSDIDQMERWARAVFVPHDEEFVRAWGISVTEVLEMASWVSGQAQQTFDDLLEAYKEMVAFQADDASDLGEEDIIPEEASEHVRTDSLFNVMSAYEERCNSIGAVDRESFEKTFGTTKVAVFWERFVSKRGKKELTYITDPNPFEQSPLLETQPNVAVIYMSNLLYSAILLQCNAHLKNQENDRRATYLKRRDDYLEKYTSDLLTGFFGDEAQVLTSVFDQPNSSHEHDILVLWKGWAFIVECKASERAEVFRDPTRAYKRLRQEFNEVIKKGHEQGARLLRLIRQAQVSNNPLPLYDVEGAVIYTIEPGEVQFIHHCCVTSDHFGYLSCDPTWLLKVDSDVPLPWCINLYELEHLLEALTLRGWGPDRLRDYITERIILFGKVQTADELEAAAVFITRGSLDSLRDAQGEMTFLKGDLAQVFNDIHMYRLGALDNVDFDSYPPPVHYTAASLRDSGELPDPTLRRRQ